MHILDRKIAASAAIVILLGIAQLTWSAPAGAIPDWCPTGPIPLNTQGATIGVAGNRVRVPSIDYVGVCQTGYLFPAEVKVLDTDPGNGCEQHCASVVIWDSLDDPTGLRVFYSADGVYDEIEVNPPGVTDGTDVCVLSVGQPLAPRQDCLVFVNLD